jgi:ubiquinone/menaquinone biosynthesis C-methylase UbiE
MNINQILNVAIIPFRKKRMEKFLKTIDPQPTERILDVGGDLYNWNLMDYKHEVVLLNLAAESNNNTNLSSNFSFVVGDGTALHYGDKEFDILFSNSTIEHVGTLEQQKDFASEVCRVGKRIWIQTPAKEFFFEPHYITPFIHWLPKDLQKKLLRNFSLWGLITRADQQYIDNVVEQNRLLSLAEIEELFPNCTIVKEKFLFMTKAYLIVKE